jgi:hypothetical protein
MSTWGAVSGSKVLSDWLGGILGAAAGRYGKKDGSPSTTSSTSPGISESLSKYLQGPTFAERAGLPGQTVRAVGVSEGLAPTLGTGSVIRPSRPWSLQPGATGMGGPGDMRPPPSVSESLSAYLQGPTFAERADLPGQTVQAVSGMPWYDTSGKRTTDLTGLGKQDGRVVPSGAPGYPGLGDFSFDPDRGIGPQTALSDEMGGVFSSSEIESFFEQARQGIFGRDSEAGMRFQIQQLFEQATADLDPDATEEERQAALAVAAARIEPLTEMLNRLILINQNALFMPLAKQLFPGINLEALAGTGFPLIDLIGSMQSIVGSRRAPALAPVVRSM